MDNDTGKELAMKMVETALTNPATQKVSLLLKVSFFPLKFAAFLLLLGVSNTW